MYTYTVIEIFMYDNVQWWRNTFAQSHSWSIQQFFSKRTKTWKKNKNFEYFSFQKSQNFENFFEQTSPDFWVPPQPKCYTIVRRAFFSLNPWSMTLDGRFLEAHPW